MKTGVEIAHEVPKFLMWWPSPPEEILQSVYVQQHWLLCREAQGFCSRPV